MHLYVKHPSKHLVCDDFKVNILTFNEDSKRLTHLLQGFDLPLFGEKIPTRITTNSNSCIDLLFANCKIETIVKDLKIMIIPHYS